MSQSMVSAYLYRQKNTGDEEIAAEWRLMEEFHNAKLWNELTIKLDTFVKNPKIQNEQALMQLYTNFIATFETKINPFKLVEILTVTIGYIKDKQEAIAFIEKLKNTVKTCEEAVWMCQVLQGQIYLEFLNNKHETKKIVEDLQDVMEEPGEVTPVHAKYFWLASAYYRANGQHADYYRSALKFLGCSTETLPKQEKANFAFTIGISALLGDGIYNIGELLAHPIIESLRGTTNEWLIKLLHAFNSGNIGKFEEMKPSWSSINDLKVQEVKLRQKISLLCLMEMTFKRSADMISFAEIANATRLPLKEVELLIMKALAQDLVHGEIDQVSGVVNMTWVQPRILNRKQMSMVYDRFDEWTQSITQMELLIESNGQEFLKINEII